MNDDKMVSIIIPAYNVEQYIFRAIESSISQTYGNIEIIIVNDGSTDNTLEVINSYLDEKIKVYDQRNSGVSAARNKGIEVAKGEYILFLDADDWLEDNAVEKLVNLAKKNNEYLIAVERYFAYIKEDKICRVQQNADLNDECVNVEMALLGYTKQKYNLQSSCYKLFQRQIVVNNDIKFDVNIFHGEDGLFVFRYLNKVRGLLYSSLPLWNILERPNSATTAPFNEKWLTALDAVEQMISYEKCFDIIQMSMIEYYCERAILIAILAYQTENSDEKLIYEIREKGKKYSHIFLKSKYSLKRKGIFIILFFLPSKLVKAILYFIKKNK